MDLNASDELTEETFDLDGLEDAPMEVSNEFVELFRSFDPNIDGLLLEKSWKQYDQAKQQVLLEGNEKAWMVCAFYTGCYLATPYGQEPMYQFSLLKLLKICNISVLEFSDKLNRWLEMINASRRLRDHVFKIQGNLATSTVVYKKFIRIFRTVFQIYTPIKKHGNEVTTEQVFKYLWTALVSFKKYLSNEDLLNTYHIMMCLIESVFAELAEEHSSVLNPDFVKLIDADKKNELLDFFCQQFDGVELDAKHLRTHWLLPIIKQMQYQGVLLGPPVDEVKSFRVLDNIEHNRNQLSVCYEENMKRKMEVDERMFISHIGDNIDMIFNESLDDSAILMLRRADLDSQWAVDADLLLRMSTQACLQKVQVTAKPLTTPLSAKSYVISAEQFCPATPISAASYRAQKLQELIAQDFKNADNEFERLVGQCTDNPKMFISNRVEHLETLVVRRVEEERAVFGDDYDAALRNALSQRLNQAERLFYRFLQHTVMYDRSRNPRADIAELSTILHKTDFITGLYVAALELVMHAYASEREFPWSTDAVQLAPTDFYKCIEIVIRSDADLAREMVKHLNRCEEKVLDELAWRPESSIWPALQKRPDTVPPAAILIPSKGVQVAPPTPGHIGNRYVHSPLKAMNHAMKRRMEFVDMDSVEAKRRLDESGLSSATLLFFRKFYYLAAIRLTDLCDRIRVDEPTRTKVWTVFEHVMRQETSLMLSRHLDQNLMCCLYIVAKVGNHDIPFQTILHHYRTQPQSNGNIYRRVILDPNSSLSVGNPLAGDDSASRDSTSSQHQPQHLRSGSIAPPASSNSHTPEPQETNYGDLIKYYNTVFVPRVEAFVKRLHPVRINKDSKDSVVILSPMPRVTSTTLSPRRMVGEQLAVIPMSAVTHLPKRNLHPPTATVQPQPPTSIRATPLLIHPRQRPF